MYFPLPLKNLLRRKVRTLLSAIGIALGVLMIVSLVSVADGMRELTNDMSKMMGKIIYVLQADASIDPTGSILDMGIVSDIEKIPEVEAVSPMVWMIGPVEGYNAAASFLGSNMEIIGIDPEKEVKLQSPFVKLTVGRVFDKDEKDGAILGAAALRNMNKKVGDTVKILYKGEKYPFTITGVYETGNTASDGHLVVNLAELQKIMQMPRDRIHMIGVTPTRAEQSSLVARKIKLMIPNVDSSYMSSAMGLLSDFTNTLQLATWVIAGIAALIGGIGIMNTMAMAITERTKEIGIMKAVGWTERDIIQSIVLESVMISLIGAIVGIGLGCLVVLWLLPSFFGEVFSPILTLPTLLGALLFAVFLGVVGGFLPAKRAAGFDPIDAFRAE
jgi:putative ABC transport system permease protein